MHKKSLGSGVAIAALGIFTVGAAAAVAPGTYKGSLYGANGAKLANAPVKIVVAGTKITITAPRLPIKCQAADGTFTAPSPPTSYTWKGTLKGNSVSGNYISPVGGTGEYFTAKGSFSPAKNSFTGKVGFVGRCKGTSTAKATKP
jgi:hypothetical protein